MSRTSRAPPAFCEDVDETYGTTLPGTRVVANANVGIKRSSKDSLDDDQSSGRGRLKDGSIAGDSGYVSQGATTADDEVDPREYYFEHRLMKVSKQREKERRGTDSRPDYHGRRSISHAESSYSRSSHRSPNREHDRNTCWECAHPDVYERGEKKASREGALETQSRPQLRMGRSISQWSNSTRPVSVDYGRPSRQIYQTPPSWGPPSPQYPPQPQQHPYMTQQPGQQYPSGSFIQYNPSQGFEMPPPTPTYGIPPPHHPVRRATITQAPTMVHGVSYAPSAIPVSYSAAPIPDARIPPHHYAEMPLEIVPRRRDEEARRIMPPPPRPGMSRYATTTTISQPERSGSSRRLSTLDPVSGMPGRPPSVTSQSYAGASRRYSVAGPLLRSATLNGYEHSDELREKVHDVEAYQKNRDVNPRVSLTSDSVKKNHPPSNAGSHKSKSSRSSGHKSGSAVNDNVTIQMGEDCTINFGDAVGGDFNFQRSAQGFRITFEDNTKDAGPVPPSRDAIEHRPSRSERRSSRRYSRDELPLALERLSLNRTSSHATRSGSRRER